MKTLVLHEEELVTKCRKGDRHSQEFLFNQYYKEIYLLAMRYLSDHHAAEDVIAIAFTKVFKSLKSFTYTGSGSLGKWIRTIAINESIRHLRKKNILDFNENLGELNIISEQAGVIDHMQANDILRMIERMPSGYRTVFNLFAIEGYSHKEIGSMLGISENTSKTQLKKARGYLMDKLKNKEAYGTQ